MSNDRVTFVEACLHGKAFLTEVDDWVDEWHDSNGMVAGESVTLDDFLGFSPEEGRLWAEQPQSLRFIVAAHRFGRGVSELLTDRDDYALAARSSAPSQASGVLKWLQDHGRLTTE